MTPCSRSGFWHACAARNYCKSTLWQNNYRCSIELVLIPFADNARGSWVTGWVAKQNPGAGCPARAAAAETHLLAISPLLHTYRQQYRGWNGAYYLKKGQRGRDVYLWSRRERVGRELWLNYSFSSATMGPMLFYPSHVCACSVLYILSRGVNWWYPKHLDFICVAAHI